MITLTLALSVGYFVLALVARTLLKIKVCALCAAISLTWVTLVLLHLFGLIVADPLVLGIFMGGSAVGLLYYVSSKFPERYHVFKFPFLVSLLYVVYEVVVWCTQRNESIASWTPVGIVAGVWAVTGSVFWYRNTAGKEAFKKLIECCKNW